MAGLLTLIVGSRPSAPQAYRLGMLDGKPVENYKTVVLNNPKQLTTRCWFNDAVMEYSEEYVAGLKATAEQQGSSQWVVAAITGRVIMRRSTTAGDELLNSEFDMVKFCDMEGSLFSEKVIDGLTDETKSMPKGLLQELKEFKDAWVKHNGLIAGGAAKDLLCVSTSRWNQIKDAYMFTSYEFQGIRWYGRDQLELFYKQNRKAGQAQHDGIQILKSMIAEANK